jgi:hypothetical protein
MRSHLLTALVALVVVSSGCVGLITGETVAFEAEPATVDSAALDSTGYEENRSDSSTITRNVSVVGQERTVRITNHVSEYRRAVELGPLGDLELARVVVLSTPGAKVAGQTLNPAASWSNRRLVEEVVQRSEGVSDVTFERNRTVRILGESRTVSTFSGTSTVQGQEIDVLVHVTSFEHEGDVIVAVGVHPQRIDEQDRVDTMFGGIQHSGD